LPLFPDPQKGFCPYFLLQNPGNAPKWIEYITNLQNKSASQKQKRQDTTTTIACLSEPPSHALLTTESSTRQTERPSGQKKSKNDQQRTETWQQALARSQKEMVEQTQLQNDLLSSQTKAMNSIAEDLRLMVEDSFMSKDYSHMDEQTQRYYELKKTSTLSNMGSTSSYLIYSSFLPITFSVKSLISSTNFAQLCLPFLQVFFSLL
jgi:hypothetical protein